MSRLPRYRRFGQNVIVCLNKFPNDTDETIALMREHIEALGLPFAVNRSFSEGSAGSEEFAATVVAAIEHAPRPHLNLLYADSDSLTTKIERVCKDIYGAGEVTYSDKAVAALASAEKMGASSFPVCIAKTQYSFTTDSKVMGAPTGHTVHIRDIVVNAGAEMVVAIAGTILRMPGLPKSPQAERIDIVNGQIEGLS